MGSGLELQMVKVPISLGFGGRESVNGSELGRVAHAVASQDHRMEGHGPIQVVRGGTV